MSAVSLNENPSCVMAGPALWTVLTSELKPMPVCCETP